MATRSGRWLPARLATRRWRAEWRPRSRRSRPTCTGCCRGRTGTWCVHPNGRLDSHRADDETEIHGARYARGRGWEAAELRYAGNQLAMTVMLPDLGTLQALQTDLDGDQLAEILRAPVPVGALDLRLPKWTFRTASSLNGALAELGMPTAFDQRTADFAGITGDEQLCISQVMHEAFVAVDEAGTEAAAATALAITATSAGPLPVSMVVDRPFLFVIHDLPTAPLFIGRITDPSA